jgi:hydrogenase/urease accessory protein HupE
MTIPSWADMVFPARLELKEVEPGVFEVNFNLPIISGKKLKARPVLPDVCRELTEHEISGTPSSYRESWQVSCSPEELYGEQIIIQGLLGTQVDVMLLMQTLDGREYSATLKPSRTSYTIPSPPTYLELWLKASLEGMRRLLKRPELLLVLLMIAFLGLKSRVLWLGFATYLIGHGLGQYLAQQNWLLLSAYLPPILILAYVLLSLLDLANNQPTCRIWKDHLWIPSLIFGLLNGGAFPDTLALAGLSYNEQRDVFIFLNLGIAAGILLGYLLMIEFRRILLFIKGVSETGVLKQWISYGAGIICFALLFYQSSALLFVPNILPPIPVRYFIYPVILGFWFWRIGWENRFFIPILFMIVLGLGLIPGLFAVDLPLNSVVILGSLLFFSIPLIFHWQFPLKLSLVISIFTVAICGWSVGFYVKENMTLPIANTLGAALVVTSVFLMSFSFISDKSQEVIPGRLRVVAGIAAGLALLWRIEEYRDWVDSEVVTEWALGLLNIPVLSLVLLIMAILIWPKKRIIFEKLELNIRRPVLHWVYLGLAFFLIPVGTVEVKNPFFEPRALTGGEAKRVLQQVLSNTFHAFNLSDEDRLYDQLSQNVSENLITDVYLDSRRRLNAGVRTGGEVTVREVSVLSAKPIGENFSPEGGFSYETQWAVIARVRHLQHVHHRQNIYNGIIRIKIDEKSWKIAAIELLSEDRVIIPGSAG